MATNIDKALYSLIPGMEDQSMVPEDAIEIEVEDPESMRISAGGVEIELLPEDKKASEKFDANLAEEMDEGELANLASELM